MMKKSIIILFAVVMVMLTAAGCRTSGPVAESSDTHVTDSTTVTVRERAVPVKVPGASFSTVLEIHCDPETNGPVLSGGQGTDFGPDESFSAELEGNRLKISYLTDSLTHEITVRDSLINRIRKESVRTEKIKEVREVRWYDTASHWVASLTLLYLLFRAGLFIKNPLINLIKR